MEKEIGSVPDRFGFGVHIEGDSVFIEQYNGEDCVVPLDMIEVHASDVTDLVDLLVDAYLEIKGKNQEKDACADSPSPAHNPDGTCCSAPDNKPRTEPVTDFCHRVTYPDKP